MGGTDSRRRSDEFERLFVVHAQALYAMFVYRTGDHALAEDLVADTFERVLRTRRRFDPRRGSEKRWIYTVGLNLLRDHVRHTNVERRSLERVGADAFVAEPDSWQSALEQRDELIRALAGLRDDEREAVALRFGADLTLREVARVLGERPCTVEKWIYRALAKLREKLE